MLPTDNKPIMSSKFTKSSILGFIVLIFIAVLFIAFGFFMFIYAGKFTSGLMIFGSLVFIWFGLLLLRVVSLSYKTIMINNNNLIIKPILGSKIKDFQLENVVYCNYLHTSYKFGEQKGIMLKSNDDTIEFISEKTYSNSFEILSYIKTHCASDKNIKKPPLSLFDLYLFLSGIIIFALYMVFQFFEKH